MNHWCNLFWFDEINGSRGKTLPAETDKFLQSETGDQKLTEQQINEKFMQDECAWIVH